MSLLKVLNQYFHECKHLPHETLHYKKYVKGLMNIMNNYPEWLIEYMYKNSLPFMKYNYRFVYKNDILYFENIDKIVPYNLIPELLYLNLNDKKQVVSVAILLIIFIEESFQEYFDSVEFWLGINICNITIKEWIDSKQEKTNLCLRFYNPDFLYYPQIKLDILPDLSNFLQLESLDIGHNNIKNVDFIIHLRHLKTFNCSYNQIKSIPEHDTIENLDCYHNKLLRIGYYKSLKRLDSCINYIHTIEPMNTLIYLNCDSNYLKIISGFPELRYLTCSNCPIEKIEYMEHLTLIDFHTTNVRHIPEFKNLTKIISGKHLFAFPYIVSRPKYLYITNQQMLDCIGNSSNKHYIVQNDIDIIVQRSNVLARMRELRYALKYREPLLNLLWKVRENIAKEKYHPSNLLKFIEENEDWVEVLDNF
jgi:Leucine Rich repeats (2 copies)